MFDKFGQTDKGVQFIAKLITDNRQNPFHLGQKLVKNKRTNREWHRIRAVPVLRDQLVSLLVTNEGIAERIRATQIEHNAEGWQAVEIMLGAATRDYAEYS
jgi:hypothetical protein